MNAEITGTDVYIRMIRTPRGLEALSAYGHVRRVLGGSTIQAILGDDRVVVTNDWRPRVGTQVRHSSGAVATYMGLTGRGTHLLRLPGEDVDETVPGPILPIEPRPIRQGDRVRILPGAMWTPAGGRAPVPATFTGEGVIHDTSLVDQDLYVRLDRGRGHYVHPSWLRLLESPTVGEVEPEPVAIGDLVRITEVRYEQRDSHVGAVGIYQGSVPGSEEWGRVQIGGVGTIHAKGTPINETETTEGTTPMTTTTDLRPGTRVRVLPNPRWLDQNGAQRTFDNSPAGMTNLVVAQRDGRGVPGNVLITNPQSEGVWGVLPEFLEALPESRDEAPEAIVEQPLTSITSDQPWTTGSTLDPYWVQRLWQPTQEQARQVGHTRWITTEGRVHEGSLCCYRGEQVPVDIRLADHAHSCVTPLNPPVQVGDLVLALTTRGFDTAQRPYLARVTMPGSVIEVDPLNPDDIVDGCTRRDIRVADWAKIGGTTAEETTSPTVGESADEPSPIAAQDRLRDMLRTVWAEGLSRGYREARDDFTEWFGQKAGVSLVNFAGYGHTATGTYSVEESVRGVSRWITLTVGNRDPYSSTLRFVSLTPPAGETGNGNLTREAAIADYGEEGFFRNYQMQFGTDEGFTNHPLPQGVDADDIYDATLTWMGERATQDDWCSEYEAFCAKNGYEARREEGLWDVTFSVELTRQISYSNSTSMEDDAIRDSFLGDSASLNSFELTLDFSTTVTITTADPDGVGGDEIEEALRTADVPSYDDIESYEEIEREQVDV